MDVFIVGVGERSTSADFIGKCRECFIETRCVFGTEYVSGRKLPHMGSGLGDVVGREPPVEVHRCTQRCHGIARAARESATPQPGWLLIHVRIPFA